MYSILPAKEIEHAMNDPKGLSLTRFAFGKALFLFILINLIKSYGLKSTYTGQWSEAVRTLSSRTM